MKLIDRYIGREIIFTALFAVSVLTFVLVLGSVFKLLDVLINHEAPLAIIISAVAYILPFSLTYTIPWGFVTAVLLVFGKLSAENELIALRSSGVGITRICVPLLCLLVVCVAICLWINLDVAPRAKNNVQIAVYKVETQDPLALFGSDNIIDAFPGRKIYLENKNGKELKNILVYELDKDSNVMSLLFAKKGELETKDDMVLLHIYDARYEQHDPAFPDDWSKVHDGTVMQESTFEIPLKALYEKYKRERIPSQVMPGELWKELKSMRGGPQTVETKIMEASIQTELNKRFSFSLASFALTLIAVPLAITAHRKETSIGFLFSIIIGFSYFFFSEMAVKVQNHPNLHPELLVWLPDILFIIFGSILFWRLSRQ